MFGLTVNLCNMSLLRTNKEVATQSGTVIYHDYLSMMFVYFVVWENNVFLVMIFHSFFAGESYISRSQYRK